MGISITRAVKFIRKGKGVIIAQSSNVFSYTESAWKNYYSTNGRLIGWAGITNAADFTRGDTMVIVGIVSDKDNIPISLYTEVDDVDTIHNVVTASSRYYIMNGKNGQPGEDAINIEISPSPILHKKSATSTTYQVSVKVYEGTKQLPYGYNGQGSNFVCTPPSTLPSSVTIGMVSGGSEVKLNIAIAANAMPDCEIPITITTKKTTYTRTVMLSTVKDGDKGDPGQNGGKGERGAILRGPQAWSDCGVGYVFQSGANGEEFKDVVMYGNNYYSCVKSHTKTSANYPTSTTDTNNGYWKLADKFEMVATKILLAQYALVKNLGVEAIDMKDSAGNIIFQAKDGNVICNSGTFKNGTFQNVKVIGSLRSPFSYAESSINTDYSDNVAMISYGGGWLTSYSMPWDVSQSGRKLSIVNYRWGNEYAQGQASISAPSGKYFFEDGLQKSELKISREVIELIGYGTSTEFYGWIVVNRIDLVPVQRYGHCLKALAYGTCAGSDTTAKTSLIYTTFDGSRLSVTRQEEGIYRITYPSTWFNGNTSNCRVIPTGRGTILGGTNPIKANLHAIGTNYFDVSVSDDNSRNDGSFDFIIYNGSDFDILHS